MTSVPITSESASGASAGPSSASPSSTRRGALWAIGGHVYPVVRYDTAHGYVHRDSMDWTGRVVDKLPIYGRSYSQAMTEAISDIRSHWRTYRAEFERRPR
jgi:hypothetical protein